MTIRRTVLSALFCCLMLLFGSFSALAQCPPGMSGIAYEGFDVCGTLNSDWDFEQSDGGNGRWGVNDNGVVNGDPPSTCWAYFDDNSTDRTATLISPVIDVSNYDEVNLSFYLEFKSKWGEAMGLSIHSTTDSLYWDGSGWVEGEANWLIGFNNGQTIQFDEAIPSLLLYGNSNFQVKWHFDDNGENSHEFAIDDFMLCGIQGCALELGSVEVMDAMTCDGMGDLEISLANGGTGPYVVTVGGDSYSFPSNSTVLEVSGIAIGTYSGFIVEDNVGCKLVGESFTVNGPTIYYENFDDCDSLSDWTFFENADGEWIFDNTIIATSSNAGIPQGSCWAIYKENNSSNKDSAIAKSPLIDVSGLANLELSFYYGFDHKGNGETLTLTIHNRDTQDSLFWKSSTNEWVSNSTAWLTAPGNGANDSSGTLSASIPATFLANNTEFQVQWHFDDNNNSSKGFAIDNFSLCGESSCAINAGTPTVSNPPPTCDGTAEIDIPVSMPTGTFFTVSIDSVNYPTNISNGVISAINIPIGTHDILITDDVNGCDQLLQNVVIEGPEFITGKSKTNPSCNLSNGIVNASVTTGSGSYAYIWNDNANSTTPSVSNLPVGSYRVTITDNQTSCTSIETMGLVNKGAPLVVTTDNIAAPTSCGQDGTAAANHNSGGAVNVTYLWDTGETTQTAVSLDAGIHTVTVTNNLDNIPCEVVETADIPAGPDPISLSQPNINPISCNGGSDGSMTGINISNGTAPYTFQWQRDGNNLVTTKNIFNIPAGTYVLFVTDAGGCTVTVSHTLVEPDALNADFQNTNIDCNGEASGAIDITMSGGTAPYTYEWGPIFSDQEDLNNITAGTYIVEVTDANGCVFNTATTLTDNPEITIGINQDQMASCNGQAEGEASISITGGVSGYTYLWDNEETTSTATALLGGLHTVTVTDALGCTQEQTINITEPPALSATAAVNEATCLGASNGSAVITPAGGTTGYTYIWSDGQTGQANIALDVGIYTFTVTDANDCTTTVSVTVGESSPISLADNSVTPVSCNGESNGQITVNPADGLGGPYTFEWEDGTTSNTISALPEGNISLTVTDGNCSAEQTFYIVEPDPLTLGADNPAADLCGETLVPVTASAAGGNDNYEYLWSDGTSNTTTNVMADLDYTVTVTDAKDCTATYSFMVGTLPLPVLVTEDSSEIAICIKSTESFTLNLDDYFDIDSQYEWSISNWEELQGIFESIPDSTGIVSDEFTHTLALQEDKTIGEVTYEIVSFTNDGSSRCDGDILYLELTILPLAKDENFFVPNLIINGTPWGILLGDKSNDKYQVAVYNRSGAKVHSEPLNSDVQNQWNGQDHQEGVYYYIITDDKGDKLKTGAVLLQK